MGKKRSKIPGARKLKGRFISGHPRPLEVRTFQETDWAEGIDRVTRAWRPEPRVKPNTADELHRLLGRLRGFDGDSLPVQPSGGERKPRPEPQAPKGPGKTVEQRLGGYIYTIAWPSGEILDKREEV